MTRDQIRGLIGAYATGSLSEEERGILFHAALEDQEIFNELAREQALKDAIEQPGGRERLLRALAPKPTVAPKAWWKPMWVWAAAAAAAVALISGIVVLRSPQQPLQIAKIESPPPPAPQVQPGPAPVAPPPAPKKIPLKAAAPPPEVAAQPPEQQQAGAVPKQALAAAPPPVPAPAAPRVGTGPAPAGAPAAVAQGTVAGIAGAGGVGGGGGGAGPRALAAPMAARPAVPQRFAFDYSVTPENALHLTLRGNGFLTVEANNGKDVVSLVTNRSVSPGMSVDVPFPAEAVTVTAILSARPMSLDRSLISGVDPPSGTKTDPNPSPDSLLVAMIPLKP